MLELMAFSQSQDEQPSTSPHLDRLLRSRLRKLEKRLRRQASELMSIDDTARHRLRKRLKRLRDGLELAHALLPKSKSRRRLRSIAPLQIALGRYNDMCQALTQFETMTPTAGRWFAKGWAMTRKQDLLKEAQQALCRWLAT
jgi:CHAD domain-containing protein